MSHSPHSSRSTPVPTTDDSPEISSPRAPPTPPDSDTSARNDSNATNFPPISPSPSQSSLTSFPSQGNLTFASVVVSSPPVPSLPTSVSSPAWFPAFDATSPESPSLIQSSSSATLFEPSSSPSASPSCKSTPALSASSSRCELSPEIPVHEIKHSALEEGEITADAQVLMKSLGLQDPVPISIDHGADQILVESPVLPSAPSPPRAPSRPTIPLPPVDAEPTRAPPKTTPPAATPDPDKTPNVYINGLPPNFPEDQLFALAAPFGEVRSVRSFTRHVGDAETGYGFVLFESIASAEKCINSLRRYRNLHPTFSKQVHKIPGTMYSQPRPAASDHTPSASSLAGWEQESAGDGSADSTFKAKMERLADRQSTNLYIEGLPLSIDEPTLAALVSPYSIRSSRFFQTKLSSPPRIIAFVRLETRSAAEEIIERLHGRMVRGWNDPGSRISVRFADTSEQRELRRTERITREGDQVSNQLSIAQATLLNLRGQDLHTRSPIGNDFHADAAYGQQLQAGYPANDFEVDYSRVPACYPPISSHFGQQQQSLPAQQAIPRMNPAMASLLDSLQASQGRDGYVQDYRGLQHQQLGALPSARSSRSYTPQGLGISQAHGGYTATEEFILRARANSLPQNMKRRPAPLDLQQARQHEMDAMGVANIGMGVRGYRTQASTVAFPHQHGHSPLLAFSQPDSMNEEDFHASPAISHSMQLNPRAQQFDVGGGDRMMNKLNNAHNHSLQHQHTTTTRMPRGPASTHTPMPNQSQSSHHDFRVSLPANSNNNQQTHHYQHPHTALAGNARAMTTSRAVQANSITNTNGRNSNNINISTSSNNNNSMYDSRSTAQRGTTRHNGAAHMYSTLASDADQSPPLVSPALTYSSRSSVAFSPTTPFFGSFDEDETFRAPQMDGGKVKKMNSRGATR
ncbi:hypothetical protein B0H10DRAFT_2222476 [Mycena sp. CBHHK59/15]|nr:hypothetical protein B0H10DRAFT_2222476 [Mycena sp. CBHHK59/15]